MLFNFMCKEIQYFHYDKRYRKNIVLLTNIPKYDCTLCIFFVLCVSKHKHIFVKSFLHCMQTEVGKVEKAEMFIYLFIFL